MDVFEGSNKVCPWSNNYCKTSNGCLFASRFWKKPNELRVVDPKLLVVGCSTNIFSWSDFFFCHMSSPQKMNRIAFIEGLEIASCLMDHFEPIGHRTYTMVIHQILGHGAIILPILQAVNQSTMYQLHINSIYYLLPSNINNIIKLHNYPSLDFWTFLYQAGAPTRPLSGRAPRHRRLRGARRAGAGAGGHRGRPGGPGAGQATSL